MRHMRVTYVTQLRQELRDAVWSATRGPPPRAERRFANSTFLLVGCQVRPVRPMGCHVRLVGRHAAHVPLVAPYVLSACHHLRQATARLQSLIELHGGTLLQEVGEGAKFVVRGRDPLSFADACTLRQAERSNLSVVGRSKIVGEAEALQMLAARDVG